MIKLERPKVFRDSLYGYVRVQYDVISKLIDTKEFQRLRRIKQLSGVQMVFHLAEHSRFQHALGTYELARRVLQDVQAVQQNLDERSQLVFLAAALLHDVGHGPYSHSFEHIFGIDHEMMSCEIIKGPTEISAVLDTIDLDFKYDVANVIHHDGKFYLIESLISSQLDVDRLDYLCRDSYFTGATYGQIDLEKILRSIEVLDGKVVYRSSAIHTIENYLLGRYHMYWTVYYHPVARCYEVMLFKILRRASYLLETDFCFKEDISLLRSIKGDFTLNDYIELDDTYINGLIKAFQKSDDNILSELAQGFMNRHLFCYADQGLVGINKLNEIKRFFKDNPSIAENYYMEDEVRQTAYKYNEYEPQADQIFLIDPLGNVKPLTEASEIVRGILGSSKKSDTKVFFDESKMHV